MAYPRAASGQQALTREHTTCAPSPSLPHGRSSSEPEQEHVCDGGGGGSIALSHSKDGAGGMEDALNAVRMVACDVHGSPAWRDANGSPLSSPLPSDARAFLPYDQKADDPKVIGKFLFGTSSSSWLSSLDWQACVINSFRIFRIFVLFSASLSIIS